MSRPDYLKQIGNRIRSLPEGSVFITSDFLDLADTPTINKALSRLSSEGAIRRIVRGVYDRPSFSGLLLEHAAPDINQAAKAIARNFGWTIVPCGDTALVKEVGEPAELTAELLNTLIEKILIHEATKDEFGFREQEIEIIYRFVGKID